MSLALRAKSTLLRWLDARAETLSARLGAPAIATGMQGGDAEAPEPVDLLEEARRCAVGGNHEEAALRHRAFLRQQPRHGAALHGLGLALYNLGRFREAAESLQVALEVQPDLAEARNLRGSALRALGRFALSEIAIRRALEADPENPAYRNNLGKTLLLLSRGREAADIFGQLLRLNSEDMAATVGLAEVARLEGRFAEAEALLKRALQLDARLVGPLVKLASLRKMHAEDADWLKRAQDLLALDIAVPERVSLLFAVGKYWDDLGDYGRAFENFTAANELLKTSSKPYNREARAGFVDDMIRTYTPELLVNAGADGAVSGKPVLVVGMPRSGTSLVEQIIASHPDAAGAGELSFWTEALLRNPSAIRQGLLATEMRRELSDAYLAMLDECSRDALRVVDKAPVNSEYLGFIYSVVPGIRIIYVRRNPIDACLSCYFQYLSPALSYTMDLADLAHYYRQHHRQMAHWRALLPAGSILEVPYQGLVEDQEGWTRKILQFVGLEWNERCLQYHESSRVVVTASAWQVRQKIYHTSVGRWRHYEPYIGPLLELQDLVQDDSSCASRGTAAGHAGSGSSPK